MLVNSVDFLLTFRCLAECQHCSYKAGPNRTGFIKKKETSDYLKELIKMKPLKSVWVHGGEPFLYFDCLKHIIKKADQLGIPRKGIITNSYWARDVRTTQKKLVNLKKMGLTALTFSADFFHQEFVPLKNVRNALQSAVSIGFENIYVDSYFVNDINTDNSFNQITKTNLELIEEIEGVEFRRYPMSLEGRAIGLLEHVKLNKDTPLGNCPVPFWIDGDLENPATIEIDCEGNVTLCPGICIGNTNIQSLTKIIKNYDVNNHPILSIIYEQGPAGLLKIAKERGSLALKQFANECHLCYELRKYLQPFYPYSLTPKECY